MDGSRADISAGKPGGRLCFSIAARIDDVRDGCGAPDTFVESST